MSSELAYAQLAAATWEKAIRETTEDGLLFEDAYVKVERRDGQVIMTGQPFKSIFIYEGDQK